MHRCLAVALSVCGLAVCADPPRPDLSGLDLSAHVVIDHAPREFGGLSGLIVSDDGTRAQVLSDHGKLFDIGLGRGPQQSLERVTVLRARYLYIHGPEARLDSEGLARAPDGGVFVSTENPSAVLHYAPSRSWPDPTGAFPQLAIRNTNRGLEALAVDPRGRLVTMPETTPEDETGVPIYRLEDGRWRKRAVLENMGGFLVVGADFGPDGRLYVLERAASALGFRSRIRRVTLAEGSARAQALWHSRLGRFDNLEGISLWRDAAGQVRITLVSDNNFLSVQRTEFVEFILRD